LEDILGNAAGFDAGTAVDEVDFAVVEHQRVLIATVRGASSQASLQDGIERSDEQRPKAAGLAPVPRHDKTGPQSRRRTDARSSLQTLTYLN
jgi:hypothetical protein